MSDATAWQWGRAFQLTEAYYRWAVGSQQRRALTSGLLGDARASVNLFGPDLSDMDEALRGGGTLVDLPPGIVEIRLVVIPADLQDRMRAQQLTSRAFAFAVRLMGPASRSVRSPDGVERPLWSVDARQTQSLLIWGEYREDGDLGRIWYESGLYGCDGALRAICES